MNQYAKETQRGIEFTPEHTHGGRIHYYITKKNGKTYFGKIYEYIKCEACGTIHPKRTGHKCKGIRTN